MEFTEGMQLARKKWLRMAKALAGFYALSGVVFFVISFLPGLSANYPGGFKACFMVGLGMFLNTLFLYIYYLCSYKKQGIKFLTFGVMSSLVGLLSAVGIAFKENSWVYFSQLLIFGAFAVWFIKQSWELRQHNKEVQSASKLKVLQALENKLEALEEGFAKRLSSTRKNWLIMFSTLTVLSVIALSIFSHMVISMFIGMKNTLGIGESYYLILGLIIWLSVFALLAYLSYRCSYKDYGTKLLIFSMSIAALVLGCAVIFMLDGRKLQSMALPASFAVASVWAFVSCFFLWRAHRDLQKVQGE